MCGRFIVNSKQVEPWVMDNWDIKFSTSTNLDLRPTQLVSTIIQSDGSLHQFDTKWGIKPAWSKRLLINAQAETANSKKTFAHSYHHRRCLVPCSGWYEWRSEGGSHKQKYLFQASNEQPILMAGIWFEHEDTPQLVTLTTRANSRCAEYHQRMPVIIKRDEMSYWFDSAADNLQVQTEAVSSELLSITKC